MSVIKYSEGGVAILQSGAMVVTSKSAGADFASAVEGFSKTVPGTNNIMGKIAMWGTDNLLPQKMAIDIENTGVLTAAVQAKARIFLGKGPMPCKIVGITKDGYEQLEFLNDGDIDDWMEETNSFDQGYETGHDLFGMGNAFQQLIFTPNRDYLIGFRRTDACECRFEKINEQSRRIENVILSGDWSQYSNSDAEKGDAHYDSIPLLDRKLPLWDLQSRKSGNNFMLALQYPLSGRKYYAPAPWYSAKKWVNIAQGVPEMKEAMLQNQITIKYLVEIHEAFWKDYEPEWDNMKTEAKKQTVEKFYKFLDDYLSGSKNAYKSLIFKTVYDKVAQQFVPSVKITAIEDKVKDGKHIIDTAAANIEILLPMMMNASLLGVSLPGSGLGGGAGSGSDIRESYLVQIMLLEAERRKNNTVFDIAKKINGWEKKLNAKIYFRYPNQMLTTLNTGSNTQATA